MHPIIGNYTVNMKQESHLLITKIDTDPAEDSTDKLFKVAVEIPVVVSGKHRSEKWTHTFKANSKIQFEINLLKVKNGNITTWKMEAYSDKVFTKIYEEGKTCVKMTDEECDKILN